MKKGLHTASTEFESCDRSMHVYSFCLRAMETLHGSFSISPMIREWFDLAERRLRLSCHRQIAFTRDDCLISLGDAGLSKQSHASNSKAPLIEAINNRGLILLSEKSRS